MASPTSSQIQRCKACTDTPSACQSCVLEHEQHLAPTLFSTLMSRLDQQAAEHRAEIELQSSQIRELETTVLRLSQSLSPQSTGLSPISSPQVPIVNPSPINTISPPLLRSQKKKETEPEPEPTKPVPKKKKKKTAVKSRPQTPGRDLVQAATKLSTFSPRGLSFTSTPVPAKLPRSGSNPDLVDLDNIPPIMTFTPQDDKEVPTQGESQDSQEVPTQGESQDTPPSPSGKVRTGPTSSASSPRLVIDLSRESVSSEESMVALISDMINKTSPKPDRSPKVRSSLPILPAFSFSQLLGNMDPEDTDPETTPLIGSPVSSPRFSSPETEIIFNFSKPGATTTEGPAHPAKPGVSKPETEVTPSPSKPGVTFPEVDTFTASHLRTKPETGTHSATSDVTSLEPDTGGFTVVDRSKPKGTSKPPTPKVPQFTNMIVTLITAYGNTTFRKVLDQLQDHLGGLDNCIKIGAIQPGSKGNPSIQIQVRTVLVNKALDFKVASSSVEVRIEVGKLIPSSKSATTPKVAPASSTSGTNTGSDKKPTKSTPQLARGILEVPNTPPMAWIGLIKKQNHATVKHISKPFTKLDKKVVAVTFKGAFTPTLKGYAGTVGPDTLSEIRCNKCQKFGHRTVKCRGSLKCPNCSGKHTHTECTKVKADRKCPNCEGPHSAAYKGCPTFKEYSKDITRQNTNILEAHHALCNGGTSDKPKSAPQNPPSASTHTPKPAPSGAEESLLVQLSHHLAGQSQGQVYKALTIAMEALITSLKGY